VGKNGEVVGQEISVKNAFYDVEKNGEAKAKQNNAEIYALMGNIMSAADSAALNALLDVAYSEPVDMKSIAKNEPAASERYVFSDESGKLVPFVVGKDTLYTMAAVNTNDPVKKAVNTKKEQITKETILKPNQIYIVYFDTDKSNLKADAMPELEKVYDFLKKNPSFGVSISGHTDNVGTKERNQLISENRAKEVAKYMVTKGISGARTLSKGYGQMDPLNNNATEDEKKKNRRVEITLVELKKAN
jgi:outer membrane protein OmpA-like peptidoglycan-associated protein